MQRLSIAHHTHDFKKLILYIRPLANVNDAFSSNDDTGPIHLNIIRSMQILFIISGCFYPEYHSLLSYYLSYPIAPCSPPHIDYVWHVTLQH